uniref:molybdopterin biosynthesis protein n=1 Tax=Hypnea cervicornis TaxID=387623 RepID=UPI0021B60D00|nr:molybdopterin biosynthesis protein [Hypnea cervicornis]UVW80655.1 molybdopterin biosynthesis protein [Hypnea cervicornis]
MLNPNLNKEYLLTEEYINYARHLTLDKFNEEGQLRLKNAKILVIGAGGLGCPAIIYLVLSGLGHLGIIDHDIISKSNLHRQILYHPSNIEQLKSKVAKENLKKMNPQCKITTYCEKIHEKNAKQLIKNYDIILDTSDNFDTRYLIDDICNKLHKVHIYGAIENFEGHISVFNYKNGPRYSDLYPHYLQLKDKLCTGVLNVLPGIIGILQATEAIKIITGIGKTLSGYLLIYNSLDLSFKKIKIKNIKHVDKVTNTYINSKIIDINNLHKYIQKNHKISIIDIRQKIEFNKNHITNAFNIPLKKIKNKNNLELIKKLSSTNIVIIYCSHNSRSIIASELLSREQIKHYRLKDGFSKWQ